MKSNLMKVLLALSGILVIAEIVATFIALFEGVYTVSVISLLTLCQLALYGTVQYKKPHGNTLRYIMFLLVGTIFLNASSALARGNEASLIHVSRLFVAGILCFVAGRLDRIQQNKYLLIISEVVLVVTSGILTAANLNVITLILLFRFFYAPITLFCITVAYIARYKEHKESGAENPEK